jgi:hypothetical protein
LDQFTTRNLFLEVFWTICLYCQQGIHRSRGTDPYLTSAGDLGTFVAARLTGLSWRDAAALGTLMNTRGLMELIVLNIGLDLGVVSPALFAMMVVMGLVTEAAAL